MMLLNIETFTVLGVTKARALISACLSVLLMPSVSHGAPFFVDDTSVSGGPFYSGESWGASWGDFNGDLYPDLFSSNHGTLNSILRNNGDGTFSETVEFADSERVWTDEPVSDIHGGTWGDFDNDGDQDMFVTRSSIGARIHLMRNSGLGGLEEIGGAMGVGPYGGGRMTMLFDYDNDGFLDLALARVRSTGAQIFNWDPALNKYALKAIETGLDNQCFDNTYGMVSDLFNDGKLHYLCASEREVPEKIFDTSTIPFTDVSATTDKVGTNADAVLADFNNDLKMDLFATRGLIRQSGAARVSDTSIEAWFSVGGTAGTESSEKSFTFKADGPITVNAYERNIGNPNGFKIGSSGYAPSALPVTLDPADAQTHGVTATRNLRRVYVGYDEVAEEWTVYLTGAGKFAGAYITVVGEGLTQPAVEGLKSVDLPIEPRMLLNNGSRLVNSGPRGIGAISCNSIAAADFDNDMDVDLYLACASGTENLDNRLYLNDGSGNFSLSSLHGGEGPVGAGIASQAGTAESVVVADYNIDGRMDLFVTNGARLFPHFVQNGFSAGGPNTFIRNVVDNNNHWLQFDLQGVTSNRDAFGAKVIITAGGVSQVREQNGMYHRWSHDSRRLHFGLGSNTSANVRVEWPDGSVDTYDAVASDKLYRAVQGDALNEITPALNAPSLAIAGDAVIEGDSVSLSVEMFPPSTTAVSVDYETVNLDAISTIDYSPVAGTLTFDPEQIEKKINVLTLLDLEDEIEERFEVRLSNPVDVSLNQGVGAIGIIDDDDGGADGPVVSVTSDDELEGGVAAFRFVLSAASTETVSVRYATESLTATAGVDYQPRTGKVTFPPGVLVGNRQTIIYQDTEIEPDETFVLKLSDVTNANILEKEVTVTILDDDAVVPNINISDVSVNEGDTAEVIVTLSEATTSVVTVDLNTAAVSATSDVDFQALVNEQVVFQPGQLSVTQAVVTIQDNVEESDETFRLTLSNATNATNGNDIAIGTIIDDDAPPLPNISITNATETEGGRPVFVISLDAASADVVTVDFATVAGSAQSDVDYEGRPVGRITFQPGELSLTRRVTTIQDNAIEPNETFSFVLSNPVNATIVAGTGLGTIVDDDAAPNGPNISVTSATAIEGDKIAFVIGLDAVSADIVTVEFSTAAGSASSSVDYEERSTGLITFQPGELSLTRRVTTIQDDTIESNETLSFVLSNPVNATIVTSTGLGTIIDDDAAPLGPGISISDAVVTEGGRAPFTVSLSAASVDIVTVEFSTDAGSADSGVDYLPRPIGRITFQPGETSAIRQVTTLQDSLVEANEQFSVRLSNETNAHIVDSIGDATILDDD